MATSPTSIASDRDRPAYPLAEAARYARVPRSTLRAWVMGRVADGSGVGRGSRPLIRLADANAKLLSFNNLIEAHMLRALRLGADGPTSGASVRAIRTALDYAETELRIDRLLLHEDLLTDRRHLFLDQFGRLVNLSLSGQIAIEALLRTHLHRIERDSTGLPIRLYPFVGTSPAARSDRIIAIDPTLRFGRPVVMPRVISTDVIVERIDAGETVEEVADDYDLSPDAVREAILYERAA